jgi:cellulose synthase operon protein C
MTTVGDPPDRHDPHDEIRAKVGQYFDGELAAADEPAVLDHLADCERCQAELGDVVGIHVAAATPRVRDAEPARRDAGPAQRDGEPAQREVVPLDAARKRSRRWRGAIAAAAVVAAAAAVAVVVWPRETPRAQLVLAPSRAIEARFEGGPFAAHRPYAVMRGASAREPIALDALADLERRGDRAVLIAALASSGDVARARDVAAAGSSSASDRAAIALVAGAPEEALALLEGRATTPAAIWNLALAARELGLPLVARRRFTEVVERGEPGWRDEAARQVTALDEVEAARTAFRDFQVRARAMIGGAGPAITPADAAQFPAQARATLLDALRVAADREAALALAPIAEALDRATGGGHARAALDRVAASRFAVRARFRERFRALAGQALEPAKIGPLIDELRRAGRDAEDILIGALFWTGQIRSHLSEVRTLVAPHRDPWFDLLLVYEGLSSERAALGAAAVVDRARAAADACADAWAFRCGQIAFVAAQVLTEVGRDDDAITYARRARAHYAAAAMPILEDRALAYLGELERYRDRRALARATFEEAELRAAGTDCLGATYAQIGRAKLALVEGQLASARSLLPAPDACGAPPDRIAVTIAVDLARESGSPDDRTAAEAWLAAARRTGDPVLVALAEVGAGRLAIAADPSAGELLRDWLVAHPPGDADNLAQRAWATGALVAGAGERGAWAAVADAAATEIGASPTTGCWLIASVDQDRQVVAARDTAGRWLGRARRAPVGELDPQTFVPGDIAAALAGCPRIGVIARPPLHGKTALLSPSLPWAFVGGPPRPAGRGARRTVIVTDVAPPEASLQLPRLEPGAAFPDDVVVIRGGAATPARVLAELAGATYVEINAHGVADIDAADASFLALSPEPSGRFMLTAGDVRGAKIDGAVVVLAACRGARLAPYLHRRWTLPDAFVAAGARAVIATDIDVPDASAGPVLAEIRARIERGEPPAATVAAVRAAAIAKDPNSWVARIAVFE